MSSLVMSYEESQQVWPQWIAAQRIRFNVEHYSAVEAGLLARLVGFDPMFVYQKFSHYEDVLAGTDFDRRARTKVKKAQHWLLSFRGLSLQDSWDALGEKLLNGKDFDE